MEDFVSYDIAVKLKEKGFSERTFGAYMPPIKLVHMPLLYSLKDWNKSEDKYSAPTISQVLKWLREDKGLYVDISLCKKGYYAIVYETNFPDNKDYANSWYVDVLSDTYEQITLACIEYVLNNLI